MLDHFSSIAGWLGALFGFGVIFVGFGVVLFLLQRQGGGRIQVRGPNQELFAPHLSRRWLPAAVAVIGILMILVALAVYPRWSHG